jgi:uncharacterized RDD family membrane protein YckC
VNADPTDVVGRRVGAALVDFAVLFVLFVVLALLVGDSESGDGGVSLDLEGVGLLVWLVVSLAYYGVLEALMNGQTLGKRALGIRVVDDDGTTPARTRQIVVRTLLRVLDGLFFYAVALAVVLATGQRRQRIGDLTAGTVVVRV